MKTNEFIDELIKIGISLDSKQLDLFKKYAEFLMEYNKKTNLTAIREMDDIYLKHFYDSLLVCCNDEVDFSKVDNLIDIGSGAGFPGVVLKIVYPSINLTLLDSNNKKTKFLQELVDYLGLKNVEIVNDRAENYVKNNRHKFDVSVARAVSELRIISELCLPLTKVDGYFIALKSHYEEELAKARDTIRLLNGNICEIKELTLPFEKSLRANIIIKVTDEISSKYPRTYDQILKKALK